jgi:hypothetical protein
MAGDGQDDTGNQYHSIEAPGPFTNLDMEKAVEGLHRTLEAYGMSALHQTSTSIQ